MALDINTKKLKKNAFRVSKERGIGASRIRVPGGYLNAEVLGMIQEIAQTYGNGFVHLTTRQGFEIEGIKLEDMDAINEKLQPIIETLNINQDTPNTGYPASGTRNISFDMVVRTMKETGHHISEKFRETSEGGLAKLYSRRMV